jgi:hypothetical protein
LLRRVLDGRFEALSVDGDVAAARDVRALRNVGLASAV